MSAPRPKLLSFWKRLYLQHWSVTNITFTDSTHYCVKFTIPGLCPESFDRNGNPHIHNIMKLSALARIFIFEKTQTDFGKGFLDWNSITEDRHFFVTTTHFQISKQLYNPDISKWPLDVECALGFVGNSSVSKVTHFFSRDNISTPLWSQISQLVSVDKDTRKPMPLPDWFKEKYKEKCSRRSSLVITPSPRPSVTYCMPVIVRWSDTDPFNHTNFSSYAHWVINAIHSALLENTRLAGTRSPESGQSRSSGAYIPGINKDMMSNGLKDLQIRYTGESMESDHLDVHVWQKENFDNIVFAAVGRGNQDICQMQLEFFTSPVE